MTRPHTTIDYMKKSVIAFIVQHIKIEYETIKNNNKLDIDVLLYDNSFGIRRNPIIYLNNRNFKRYYGSFPLRY